MGTQCGPSKQTEALTPGGGPIVVAGVQKCNQQYTRSVVKSKNQMSVMQGDDAAFASAWLSSPTRCPKQRQKL